MPQMMKAAIFAEPSRIVLDEKPVPDVGPLDALIRITTTTTCGTDVHILKGEYRVARGLTIGHEPVGIIEKLGSAVQGYAEGQRVIAGAITPCGNSNASPCGCHSQDGPGTRHSFEALGGWRFGNTIDGAQAEFLLVPDAMANMAPIPDGLSDERMLMCPDLMSTGFSGAERGRVKVGDTVAVLAQGPIGLCAMAGARLMGATTIIGIEAIPERAEIARKMGADHVVDFTSSDPVDEIMRLTGGRGVDAAIEALGMQQTFEGVLRVLRPGGTLSSLGVYAHDLKIPLGAFPAGLGDPTIVTTLCLAGKSACVGSWRSFPLDASTPARSSRTGSRSNRSRRRTSSSPTSETASSRSLLPPEDMRPQRCRVVPAADRETKPAAVRSVGCADGR